MPIGTVLPGTLVTYTYKVTNTGDTEPQQPRGQPDLISGASNVDVALSTARPTRGDDNHNAIAWTSVRAGPLDLLDGAAGDDGEPRPALVADVGDRAPQLLADSRRRLSTVEDCDDENVRSLRSRPSPEQTRRGRYRHCRRNRSLRHGLRSVLGGAVHPDDRVQLRSPRIACGVGPDQRMGAASGTLVEQPSAKDVRPTGETGRLTLSGPVGDRLDSRAGAAYRRRPQVNTATIGTSTWSGEPTGSREQWDPGGGATGEWTRELRTRTRRTSVWRQ